MPCNLGQPHPKGLWLASGPTVRIARDQAKIKLGHRKLHEFVSWFCAYWERLRMLAAIFWRCSAPRGISAMGVKAASGGAGLGPATKPE